MIDRHVVWFVFLNPRENPRRLTRQVRELLIGAFAPALRILESFELFDRFHARESHPFAQLVRADTFQQFVDGQAAEFDGESEGEAPESSASENRSKSCFTASEIPDSRAAMS